MKYWLPLSSHLTMGKISQIPVLIRKEGQSEIHVIKLFCLCLPGSSFKGRIPGREIRGSRKPRHGTGMSVTALGSCWEIADGKRKCPPFSFIKSHNTNWNKMLSVQMMWVRSACHGRHELNEILKDHWRGKERGGKSLRRIDEGREEWACVTWRQRSGWWDHWVWGRGLGRPKQKFCGCL